MGRFTWNNTSPSTRETQNRKKQHRQEREKKRRGSCDCGGRSWYAWDSIPQKAMLHLFMALDTFLYEVCVFVAVQYSWVQMCTHPLNKVRQKCNLYQDSYCVLGITCPICLYNSVFPFSSFWMFSAIISVPYFLLTFLFKSCQMLSSASLIQIRPGNWEGHYRTLFCWFCVFLCFGLLPCNRIKVLCFLLSQETMGIQTFAHSCKYIVCVYVQLCL